MKTIVSLLFFCVFLWANPASAQQKNIQKAVIQTSITCNHCKACGSCGKNLQTHLYKIKGLKTFDINEQSKEITVYYDQRKTTLETIRKRIASLGFDADEVKASPEAFAMLEECCK